MPSRVRAYLYNEKFDELIDEMYDSLQKLVYSGANKIILACNTSHLFLEYIYKKNPDLKNVIVNIIELCVKKIKDDNIKDVYVLASEGTIKSRIYQIVVELFLMMKN